MSYVLGSHLILHPKKKCCEKVANGEGIFPRAGAMGKTFKNICVGEEGPDVVGFFQAHGFLQKN
jgi:hypothetical protein